MAETVTARTLELADVSLGLLEVSVLREARDAVTAEDPETGETVVVEPATPLRLRFKRAFRVVDGSGRVLSEIPARTVRIDADFDELPAEIAAGLAAIDAFTRRRARIRAGLLDADNEVA